MEIKRIGATAEIAVIGLTNTGKSTFITQLIDKDAINKDDLVALTNNDGGLTKVTTHYKICSNCAQSNLEVENVIFRTNFALDDTPYSEINKFLKASGFNEIQSESELATCCAELKQKMMTDFSTTVKIINTLHANKLIKHIQIKAPASPSIAHVMANYGFEEVVFRDTKGFLDDKIDELDKQQGFTLQDAGLDGIHACIWMSGRNSAVSNLAREIYGGFIKSIFEAVPAFIVEQNGRLASKLDMLEESASANSLLYHTLVNDPKINCVSFKEIHKLLNSLGIEDDNGTPVNQLIRDNKQHFLLPEVDFKTELHIYQYCLVAVFTELMKSISELRQRINEISDFFYKEKNTQEISKAIFKIFEETYAPTTLCHLIQYTQGSFARPIVNGYNFTSLSEQLVFGDLLGPRGGITTKDNTGKYLYAASGIFAATMWNVLNSIFIQMGNRDYFTNAVKKCIDAEELLPIYTLKIQQCMQYVLQNQYTDVCASFGNWPIIKRNSAVESIKAMRTQWNEEYSKKYNNAINTVYLIEVANYVNDVMQTFTNIASGTDLYVRSSQWYTAFINSLKLYFNEISNHPLIIEGNTRFSN